jgi:hypothetical protein
VTGLWYAILAIVVGSAVVAIGGGIKTMQRYWERATAKAKARAPQLTQHPQQSTQTAAFDDGNGAAAYADTGTQEFAAEPASGRPWRDR